MTRPKTKILVDGGDPQEARRVKERLGFVDGQTTTPPVPSDALSFPAVPPGPAVTGQRSQIGNIALLVSRGHRKNGRRQALLVYALPLFNSTGCSGLRISKIIDLQEYRRDVLD